LVPSAMSPPWLLLRGLSRETRHWGSFLPQFAAAFPDSRVLGIDLPGNGVFNTLESPLRVEAMADFVRAQAMLAGLVPPYRVLAMSLGAMVTVAWAQRRPQDLSHAVLINTSLRPFSPFWQRLRPCHYAHLFRMAIGHPGPEEWERTVMALTCHHPADKEGTLEAWLRYRSDQPVSTRNTLRQLVAAARFRASGQAPGCPLLLLGSTRDNLVDIRSSRAIARAWRVPLVEHPSAGHDLPLDDPAWVIAQVNA
jgi:pimeloyl-ACP methyl ester carboxylesterase